MNNNSITIITRRELIKLFNEGYYDYSRCFWDSKYSNPKDAHVFYPYYGCLPKLDFLKNNHFNEDFNIELSFTNSDDIFILDFLCAVFNPIYRDENGFWKEYLTKVQSLLSQDGYELYVDGFISHKEIYKWRILTKKEKESMKFLPFSIRYNKEEIKKFKISNNKRQSLKDLFKQFEDTEYFTTETNWNYSLSTTQAVVNDLKEYYEPKAYNEKGEYINEEDFYKLVMKSSPKSLFDIIELFARYKDYNFERKINFIISDIGYELKHGKFMFTQQIIKAEMPHEPTLKELIQIAETYRLKNDTNSIQLAMEKIWDAFECMKTYYSKDKKNSCIKIINAVSVSNPELYTFLDEEFNKLTKIGNEYQIRHFEKGKIEITNNKIKEYLYSRCLALINLVIRSIENQ